MNKTYNSFIIGCGRIAGCENNNNFTHAMAYRSNPKTKIVGCMDILAYNYVLYVHNDDRYKSIHLD